MTLDSFSFSPQRIAMLTVHTSPLAVLGGDKTGGMNVYVRDFSRALAQQGIYVDIFTRAQDPDQPQIRHDLGDTVRVVQIAAGPQRPVPVEQVSRYLAEFTQGVLAFAASEALTYDLIHSHYWLSGLVAEALKQQWGRPIIHMFHTLGHLKNRVARHEREKAPQERILGENRVVQVADRLIAATLAERTQLLDYYCAPPDKITVIPPGVDLQRFRAIEKAEAQDEVDLPRTARNVLFTGRIEPLKGIDTLLKATALLRDRHPERMANTLVTIIGGDLQKEPPDDEMHRLRQLRCNLDLCGMVRFVGAKDQTMLPYYYAAADVVVMPSDYESFGLVALEAMATGTPVIASAVGGLAHLVQNGQTGFHVPPRDPAALAERMNDLLADSTLRQRLGSQASNYARTYDWAHIVQRMLNEVYAPLLQQ